jgi:hypothetical protein
MVNKGLRLHYPQYLRTFLSEINRRKNVIRPHNSLFRKWDISFFSEKALVCFEGAFNALLFLGASGKKRFWVMEAMYFDYLTGGEQAISL